MSEKILNELKNEETIKIEIKEAELKAKGLKVDVLKYFLLNLRGYNSTDNVEEKNGYEAMLKECTVVYKKLLEIEKSFTDASVIRKAVGDVKRNKSLKGKGAKAMTPKQKNKKRFEKQNKELREEMSKNKKKVKKF